MIEANLQQKLRDKYNPEGSDLRKKQLRMLEMLKYIDSICKKNNIKYWLSSGTCLGAVRHCGFIPWDDDVDIELMEDDYNKLIELLRNNKSEDFVIQTHQDDPNYIMDFAKLRDKRIMVKEVFGIDKSYKYQGLFIDIFKMVPSGSNRIHYLCGRLRVLEIYIKRSSLNNRISKYAFQIIRPINNSIIKILSLFDRLLATNYIRHTLGVPFLKPRKKTDIEDVCRVKFEGYMLPIPINFDSYLTDIYGDYMVLKLEHSHFQNDYTLRFSADIYEK